MFVDYKCVQASHGFTGGKWTSSVDQQSPSGHEVLVLGAEVETSMFSQIWCPLPTAKVYLAFIFLSTRFWATDAKMEKFSEHKNEVPTKDVGQIFPLHGVCHRGKDIACNKNV